MKNQSINYTWHILSLKKRNTSDLSGVVVQVTWQKIGTDENGNTGNYIGSTPFELSTVDPDNFVSYEDLTEEIILGWIQSIVVDGYEENVNSSIDNQIQDKISQTVEINTGNFPWQPAPEPMESANTSTPEPVGIATTDSIQIETTEPVGVATTDSIQIETTEPVGVATTA